MNRKAQHQILHMFLDKYTYGYETNTLWNIWQDINITFGWTSRELRINHGRKTFIIPDPPIIQSWDRFEYLNLFRMIMDYKLISNMQKHLVSTL